MRNALKHAWNLFNDGQNGFDRSGRGYSSTTNTARVKLSRGNERTIITPLYNRIAVDAASVDIFHVKVDDNGKYTDTIDSGLNNCLNLEANIDQTGSDFIQDIVISLLDEGVIAVVPVETTMDPEKPGTVQINSMRTGRIMEWFPKHVTVRLFNDNTGMYQDIPVPKSRTAIIYNPFSAIMNEPNSTLQRLIRKLSMMDDVDEESSSGKLDLIIQLPYLVKNETKRIQAEERRESLESQLKNSKYGVGYIDGTESITQLNRPLTNNLMGQIEYLTSLVYSQLGMTQSILDGTADEDTMNNYYNRTVEPILRAIVEEFRRKFLTKTARTQKQDIQFFRDPFKLMPISKVPDIADKLTRNEIMTSNEFRPLIGFKPSKDPAADELRNKNLNQSNMKPPEQEPEPEVKMDKDKEEKDNV